MPKIADLARLKKALIQLIEKLDGLPNDRRKSLVDSLTHKATQIPAKNTAEEISLFITLIFTTGKIPTLNAKNKSLLEQFSDQNLQPIKVKDKPSHSRKK